MTSMGGCFSKRRESGLFLFLENLTFYSGAYEHFLRRQETRFEPGGSTSVWEKTFVSDVEVATEKAVDPCRLFDVLPGLSH
jgi:hypothetical protein